VYIVGNVGDTDRVQVAAASNIDPSKMPAVGLLESDLANNADGNAVIVGELPNINTSSFNLNNELFVGVQTLSGTKPIAGDIQSVGIVSRVNSNTGVIVVNMQGRKDSVSTNTLAIGTVTSGTTPSATITGTAPNQTLNLVLPKGDIGTPGATGPTGIQGPTGDTGLQGPTGLQGEPGQDALWNFRGEWYFDGSGTWYVGDVVTRGGQTYYCIEEYGGEINLPPEAYPNLWQLIAAKGIAWNYTGEYSGGAEYAVGDVATYDGELWYRTDSNGGNVGDTPSDVSPFWDLLAAKGADDSILNVKFPFYTTYAIDVSYRNTVTRLNYYSRGVNGITYRNLDGSVECAADSPTSFYIRYYGGPFDANEWFGDGTSPELVPSWQWGYQGTPPAAPPVVTVAPSTFNINDVVTYNGSTWYCNNGYTVIPPDQEPPYDQEPYIGSPHWQLLSSAPWVVGDGISFDSATGVVSCNTNIARRAGNQTFTGNNNFGASSGLPSLITTTFFGTQIFNGTRTFANTSTFSGQVELTGQSLTNATSALTRSLADGRYSRGLVYSNVGADLTSSSTTYVVVATVTLPTTGMYKLDAFLALFRDSGTGNMSTVLRFSSNVRLTYNEYYGAVSTTSTPSISASSDGINIVQRDNTATTEFKRDISGILDVVTANTVVTLEFAQTTQDLANPIKSRKRSYIMAQKLI
jgi:hypothetical protein